MENIVKFSENIICSQAEHITEYINRSLFRDGTTLEDLANSVHRIYYLTKDFNIVEKEEDADWAVVKTTRKYGNEPVLFFAKWDSNSLLFDGYLVGDLQHSVIGLERCFTGSSQEFNQKYNNFKERIAKDDFAEKKAKEPEKEAYSDSVSFIVDNIYNHLLLNNFKSKDGLSRFIKIIGSRLLELQKLGDTRYYVENKARYAIVNTGLLDEYKEDIYVMYQFNIGRNIYNPYAQIKCKQDWIANGFEKTQIKDILPIKFYDDGYSVNNITMDDIDIPTGVFKHIIVDNKDRLEASIGEGHSSDLIADRIREAINIGIKMLERDPSYMKPYYTTQSGLSWVLPLHIQHSLSEEPEFVIVLNRQNDFYVVKTILPYNDDVKDGLTAVSLYGTKW